MTSSTSAPLYPEELGALLVTSFTGRAMKHRPDTKVELCSTTMDSFTPFVASSDGTRIHTTSSLRYSLTVFSEDMSKVYGELALYLNVVYDYNSGTMHTQVNASFCSEYIHESSWHKFTICLANFRSKITADQTKSVQKQRLTALRYRLEEFIADRTKSALIEVAPTLNFGGRVTKVKYGKLNRY